MSSVTDLPIEVQGPRLAYVPEWVMDECSDGAVHLYARLTRYVNREAECWPSRTTLAEKLRCSTDTLDRRVKELEGVGALVVERRRDPERPKRHLSSVYTLLVDKQGSRIGAARGSRNSAARVAATVRPEEKPEKKETSSRRRPETPLPADFALTPAMADWAESEVPQVPLLREFNQFKDHALAHDRRARDWVAAWRTWMRKADEMRRERAAKGAPRAGRQEWEA